MDRLVLQQNLRQEQLNKLYDNYKVRKDSKSRRTASYFSNLILKVNAVREDFVKTHEKIVLLVSSDDELKHQYFKDERESVFEEIHLTFISELEDSSVKLIAAEEIKSQSATTNRKEDSEVKLPRINLPKFSGRYDEWLTFRDLYTSLVHNRSSLSNVEKLHYLMSSLSGEAYNILRHFSITESNYIAAWDLLNERYDNKYILLNAQYKKLFSISHASESAVSLKMLLDRTVECVHTIENLKLGDLWESILIYLTTQRLPHESRQLWEQTQSSNSEFPTFDILKAFLQSRFRALEVAGLDRHKPQRNSNHPVRAINTTQRDIAFCILCKREHPLRSCLEFINANFSDKFQIVKQNGLCLNCLEKGHLVSKCPSRWKCFKCKKAHHTLLHKEDSNRSNTALPSFTGNSSPQFQDGHMRVRPAVESPHNVNMGSVTNNRRDIVLATALVNCQGNGQSVRLRALLDQGSQASLITEAAVQQLGLNRQFAHIRIQGIGKSASENVKGKVQLKLLTRSNETLGFEAFILSQLTNILPHRTIRIDEKEQLEGLPLADPYFEHPKHIDLLLGADVYANIILGDMQRLKCGLIAQSSKLGWIVSGGIENKIDETYSCYNVEAVNPIVELNTTLQKFWELEEAAFVRKNTLDEILCEKHFVENVERDPCGRYTVRLPFKSENAKNSLGYSRNIAVASLLSLERRFLREPNLKNDYVDCISEYIKLGYLKEVEPLREIKFEGEKRQCVSHYLPHHAVYKQSSTTKCRVVFDASRKSSTGVSLNDILLTGPAIQNDIISIVLNFRFYRYVYMADVSKMFFQINMNKEDANFQRIVWRSNPDEEVRDYILSTVTFGTTCAPFLAMRTLKKLAEDEEANFPNISDCIENEFYVDDLLSGGHNLEATLRKRKNIESALASGGFHLRKWISNDLRILEGIPTKDLEMQTAVNLNLDQNYKSLGIQWYPLLDQFSYGIELGVHEGLFSKRQVLSDIAHLYDPLGLLAPIVVMAKIFMKSLWKLELEWDETLPTSLNENWLAFRNSLRNLKEVRIPRWINYSSTSKIEIHGFCDASLQAYAAAVYIVIRNCTNVTVSLLLSKTKISPIKEVPIARLELCGAVLLANLIIRVKNAINIKQPNIYLWCDSETVLAWLKGHPTRWTVFVANRCVEINDLIGDSLWRYVPSKENPADLATRGLNVNEFLDNSFWWNGPAWLQMDLGNWPGIIDIETTEEERRKTISVNYCQQSSELDNIIERFSTMTRLTRVTAYCYRFHRLAARIDVNKGYLTTTELQNAFRFWLIFAQRKEFGAEIDDLLLKRPISKQSKIRNLNPLLKDGILRVGGRLEYANLTYDETHPIIIPKIGKFTELLLQQTHMATQHGQTQLMLSVLRRKFWPIDGRNTVKNFVHSCIKCFKAKASTSTQLMGSLPTPRVTMSRPFTHTGIDYCGPFDIKERLGRGCRLRKGYVAIFICLAVKAIHIELVSDMTTQAFLAAFRRFTGRRGLCRHVYSDCGSNFIGADAELRKIVDENRKTEELMANEGVKWHFIPPASPHFGGLWEAGVKSVKMHLRRAVGNMSLTFEEFTTTLIKIEACLNSRPLCPLNDDPTDLTPLTPAHFLINDSMLALPENELLNEKINRLDRWQLTQRLAQNFWRRWKEEYLTRLQQRPKWLNTNVNIRVGELCLVKDDKSPSYKWPLGRITQVHPGADGIVRVVTVRTENTMLKRPITKIAILPIENPK